MGIWSFNIESDYFAHLTHLAISIAQMYPKGNNTAGMAIHFVLFNTFRTYPRMGQR